MGTLVAYLNAFLSFSDWCVSSGWATRVPDVPALECALIEWMEERHEAGVGPYIGNCAFGAIRVLSRRIHGELEDARGLLADWNGLGHATHWPPLPYPLLFLLAEDQLRRGDVGCALAFMLAFTCLLLLAQCTVTSQRGKPGKHTFSVWGTTVMLHSFWLSFFCMHQNSATKSLLTQGCKITVVWLLSSQVILAKVLPLISSPAGSKSILVVNGRNTMSPFL